MDRKARMIDYGYITMSMALIKNYCALSPTCDNCRFKKAHTGCYFREGKTPREWEIISKR